VAFHSDGTAALRIHPPRPPLQALSSDPRLAGPGTLPPSDVGDLLQRLEELVAWLKAQAAPPSQAGIVRFGAVEVELATQVIRRAGERIAVTRTEFRLLYALIRRAGRIVSRDELAAEVWGADVRLRSRAIDTHIARLRRKLEAEPAHPRHLRTAPYLGYRFDFRGA
jgi:two-component system KDP operon response regulator KdpE